MRTVWVWDLLKIGHLSGKRSDSGERERPEKARLMRAEVREGAWQRRGSSKAINQTHTGLLTP